MKTEQIILKNTLFLTAGKMVGDICAFFFIIAFARTFGKEILGQYAFAMSVGGLASMLIGFGLNTLLELEVSRERSLNPKYLGNLLFTQGILALLVWVGIAAFAVMSNASPEMKEVLIILGGYHVFYRLSMLWRAEFRAHEENQYSALIESFHKFLILIFGGASILLWRDAALTLSVYPLSAFCMFVFGLIIVVRRYGIPEWGIDFDFLGRALQKSWPFFWILLVSQVYLRSGAVLLTALKDELAAGTYAAPDRLILALASGLALFGGAVMPSMSRVFGESKESFLKLYEQLVRLMIVLLVPCSTLLFILSEPIILIAFGQQFADSIGVLQVLCWTLIFAGLNYVMSALLFVTGNQKWWSSLQVMFCACYLLASLLLIPRFGYMGLAYSRLAVEVLLIVAAHGIISRKVHRVKMAAILRAPLCCCAATLVVFFLLARFGALTSITAAIAACIAGMFVFGVIRREDLEYAKALVTLTKGTGKKQSSEQNEAKVPLSQEP